MLKLDVDPKPKIEYLEIASHRLVTTNFMGDYQSVFKGKGIIFESYRQYTDSDDASEIDWKATVRSGKPMVKEYIQERNLDVFFLIDASYTMVFGSQKRLKHEYAAEMVASMAFAILERGDSVGVGLFTDKLNGFLMPERGIVQYRRILKQLTKPENYDGPCRFEVAVKECLQRLRPQTLLILISDGVQLDGNWLVPLKVANKKFEIVIMLVRDPRDDELPSGVGQVMVQNPYNEKQFLVDTGNVASDYERYSKEVLQNNLKMFMHSGIADVPVIRTDTEFAKHVIKFFERRKRRMR